MTFRHAFAALAVLITLAVSASPVIAQAWLPAQGEGSVSFLFQDMLAKYHYLPTTPYDLGRIRSGSFVVDVTYGLTDKVAVSIGIPLVASRYDGTAPHPQPLYAGVNRLDDGNYHAML